MSGFPRPGPTTRTGRFRYRTGTYVVGMMPRRYSTVLVLQVQVEQGGRKYWRDAGTEDVTTCVGLPDHSNVSQSPED